MDDAGLGSADEVLKSWVVLVTVVESVLHQGRVAVKYLSLKDSSLSTAM